MSERPQVDPDKLIRSGATLHGVIAVVDLPELSGHLSSAAGELGWQLQGDRDAHGRARLSLTVAGRLQLVCQRCLGPLEHDFEYRHALVLVKEESAMPELEAEEDSADFVLVPGLFDVQDAVLEELLLALPMMPRHENEHCHGPESGPETEEGGQPSPFAVLRGPVGS